MRRNWTIGHRVLTASPTGRTLLVQKELVQKTYEVFAKHGARGNEAVAYWYGAECEGGCADAVLSVAAPNARCTPYNYSVDREEMARVGREMASRHMVSLAQLHTHPGDVTEHSEYDDENAISRRNGFLSLVAPRYGMAGAAMLEGVTVHEAWKGQWHILGGSARRMRIVAVDMARGARKS